MLGAYHLAGGGPLIKKFKVGATVSNTGIPLIADTTNNYGEVIPATTTSFADCPGISLDTATYSTTQSDLSTVDRLITVSVRPDLVVKALCSGGATEGTALTTLSNTAASAGGTTITDADVGSADMVTGIVWCITGNNVGHSRVITTHNASTSFVVTVPFPRTIAVGDTFLWLPYSPGLGDGAGNLQATAAFYQADGAIASGTGGLVAVIDADLNGASDTYVYFVFTDHAFGTNDTLA